MVIPNLLKGYFLIITLLISIDLSYAQPPDSPPIGMKGCLSKTLIHDKYEYWEESFPIFTGEYNDSLDFLESIELVISPSTYEWVFLEKPQNCTPPNHSDCFELSYEYLEEDIIELTLVTDTSKTSDYIWESYELKELAEIEEEKKLTDWREVPCGGVSLKLKKEVILALNELGYLPKIMEFETIEVKEAILNIQKRNGFGGTGNITVELLEYLGIH